MTEPLNISVTQEDIDRGEKNNACWCPIALAVGRQAGARYQADVYVDMEVISVMSPGGRRIYMISEAAEEFISDFDTGRPVKPFEFTAIPES